MRDEFNLGRLSALCGRRGLLDGHLLRVMAAGMLGASTRHLVCFGISAFSLPPTRKDFPPFPSSTGTHA